MPDGERTEVFLESLLFREDEDLLKLERKAKEDNIPIIRRQTGYFLRFLLAAHCPKRILELGTATGFSAVFMAKNTPEDTLIDTVELSEKRAAAAEETIKALGLSERIRLHKTDALKYLEETDGVFDFVFLDAAKGQYPAMLSVLRQHLRPGGILLADNVFFDGDILESRFAIRRRDRTIHGRMREFLFTITHDNDFITDILPVADGMSVSVFRPCGKEDETS